MADEVLGRETSFLMPGLRHAHTLQQLRVMNTITSLVIVFMFWRRRFINFDLVRVIEYQ